MRASYPVVVLSDGWVTPILCGSLSVAGMALRTDCLEDSRLTCYWGCSVQKLYEALQKHAYCFRISTPQALEEALYSDYLHREQYLYPFSTYTHWHRKKGDPVDTVRCCQVIGLLIYFCSVGNLPLHTQKY